MIQISKMFEVKAWAPHEITRNRSLAGLGDHGLGALGLYSAKKGLTAPSRKRRNAHFKASKVLAARILKGR